MAIATSNKGTEKREQILECAKIQFAQKGYDGVSTRLLANECGVNLAMISYYFGSKEEMYKEILDKNTIQLKTDVAILQNPKSTHWDKLNAIVDVYVERFFTNKQMVQIIFKEISSNKRVGLSEFVSGKMMNNFAVIEGILEDGVKKKIFRKTDVELLIMTIFGTLMMYMNGNATCFKLVGASNAEECMNDAYKQRMKEHLKNLLKNQLTK
jgi:AcrR family transcriptional regulator